MHSAMKLNCTLGWFSLVIFIFGCAPQPSNQSDQSTGFISLPARATGIKFINTIKEDAENNVLNYEYFYNGGGIAAADFNNDGWVDLYFSGNRVNNALYLNQGNLSFSDVTKQAGVAGRQGGWNTGVTVMDINADGWLDIYLCYSGNGPADHRRNALYINQGIQEDGSLSFVDEAAQYGLDHPGHTTHALFFDYDRDGDLDVYLLNHSIEDFQNFDATYVKNQTDPFAGDKLMRNDNRSFTDVTTEAGIKSTPLGFGLGIAATDINQDGWLDLYVSNDYIEEDYLYINQKNGTFVDQLKEQMGHISHFSMGSNASDINNDGHIDLFSLDMLPEDNRRQKLLYGPDTYEKYQSMLRNGFYHQIMRNMLQLNNGDGSFSEIGQLAGISNTDWSWAPLFADYDNDGWKDLFITNGYLRDYTNRDFVSYYADQRIKTQRGQTADALMDIIAQMESTKTPNYMFRNEGDLTFSDQSKAWGFSKPMMSNGAIRADLDNDGDLDLVLNNNNEPATIFENRLSTGHYLQVVLQQPNSSNLSAIGARIEIQTELGKQVQEFIPSQGFQSAMHIPVHFGLGTVAKVDCLRVRWPNGDWTQMNDLEANQSLVIRSDQKQTISNNPKINETFFSESTGRLSYTHKENNDVDFKQQSLLPWGISYSGPATVQADFTGDGLPDLFVGGAKRQPSVLYTSKGTGAWVTSRQPDMARHLIMEDTDALAFDADGDNDLDLYVASGGYHFLPQDLALQDRLYINDGKGNFTAVPQSLPPMRTSTGTVTAADIDGDGDQDLFVGTRLIPGKYPESASSYILINDGTGNFEDATDTWAPMLRSLGMVTDATWLDFDQDGKEDLIVIGEWMPIQVFKNSGTSLSLLEKPFSAPTSGWWWSLEKADLDGDGDEDLVVGNLGENTQIKVGDDQPATIFYDDFDDNGSTDPLIEYYIKGAPYPMVSRDNLFGQLAYLKRNFTTYAAYAEASIADILTPEQKANAMLRQVNTGKSIWLENQGNGTWSIHALPKSAQISPVFAIKAIDINGDQLLDLVLGGNIADTRPSMGPWDANYGQLLLNDGQGSFKPIPQDQSGLKIIGDVRSIEHVQSSDQDHLIFFRNNRTPAWYQFHTR